MSTIGIDISGFQDVSIASGDWLFMTTKTTEGLWVSNKLADAQLSVVRPGVRKGLYHYARPGKSDGRSQANFFADDALRRGFVPGQWMWQLDAEGMLNEGVYGSQWRAFVDGFMEVGLARLGQLGFLYSGAYFFANDIQPWRFNWWLPAYGPNDGNIHPLPGNANPVLHQYASVSPQFGHLDLNVVHDQATWDALTQGHAPAQAAPPALPKPKGKKLTYLFVCHSHPYPPARLAVFITDGITYRALGTQDDTNTQRWIAAVQGIDVGDPAKLPDLDWTKVVSHMVEVKPAA